MGVLNLIFRALLGKRGRASAKVAVFRPVEQYTPAPRRAVVSSDIQKFAGPNPVVASIAIVERVRGKCYVVDGDTITIGNTNIRLAGIDAPELDQPFGKAAKWALFELCKGQVITAEMQDHFSYERSVATCFLPDGRDLSAEMVKLGLALNWTKFSGGKYRHLEPAGVRRKLWRVEAKHRGKLSPARIS